MIYVIGSINLDLIVNVRGLPKAGETLIGDKFSTAPGGKSANQALAAKRAGSEIIMVGAVGSDENASLALEELTREGVDLSKIVTSRQKTGIALISVAEDGENTIIVIKGANEDVSENMAQEAINEMKRGDILLLAQEIPHQTIKAALCMANKAGIISILNIAPFSLETMSLAKEANYVIANESEFAALIGEDIKKNFEEKLAFFARQNQQSIIVTLGENGAIAADNEGNIIKTSALRVRAIDCVGAGDSFCGYFAAMIEKGKSLKEALKIAALAGSLACTKRGAQPAIPYWEEVKKYL